MASRPSRCQNCRLPPCTDQAPTRRYPHQGSPRCPVPRPLRRHLCRSQPLLCPLGHSRARLGGGCQDTFLYQASYANSSSLFTRSSQLRVASSQLATRCPLSPATMTGLLTGLLLQLTLITGSYTVQLQCACCALLYLTVFAVLSCPLLDSFALFYLT